MKDEDIEILEDLPQNNEVNNFGQIPNINQYSAPSEPQNNQTIPEPVKQDDVSSPDDFDKLISEPIAVEKPVEETTYNTVPTNDNYVQNQMPNQYNDNYGQDQQLNQYNDANNELVQSADDQDLTITAVYPNGFVVPDQEETEETTVQPKKKKSSDLYLIIIVAVLAITLVVMLVIFYL